MRHSLTFAICLVTTSLSAQGWTKLSPSPAPSPRRTGAAAFSVRNAGVLFHGGLTTSPTAINNETWLFNGAIWRQLTPTTTPPGRWGHRMVYDSRRGVVVTFGGRSPTLTTTANDTWEWNGNDWKKMSPSTSPSPRAFYSMAFDERRGVTVMFGGMSSTRNGEHWEYDGTTWKQITLPQMPSGRETPAMCYDKGRGVVLMFGGWSSPTMQNDTWEYDGVAWTKIATTTTPIARFRASMIFDESRGRAVLYGGFGNATALQDTWEFDGTDWKQVATSGPVSSTESYMGYDRARARSYHFGGSSRSGIGGDTWSYRASSTAIFAPFGRGCSGGGGVPELAATTLPQIGKNFGLSVQNLPASAASTVLLQGFSAMRWGPLYLPLVAPIGLNGCQLEISPDFTTALPASSGMASTNIPIPNDTSLIGVGYFTQALTLDSRASNGLATLSRAGHAVLGN